MPVPGRAQDLAPVPFEVSAMDVVDAMLGIAGVGPKDFVVDLGSGDGRIVIRAATKYGARGFGVEIDAKLVTLSNNKARAAGVADRARFVVQDLFKTDIARASVVTMFLSRQLNLAMRSRLLAELAPGSRVVSHDHDMGTWKPDRELNLIPEAERRAHFDREHQRESWIYLWIVPARIGGTWRGRVAGDGATLEITFNQKFQVISGVARWHGKSALIAPKLRGTGISFDVMAEAQGPRRSFKGRIEGDVITGTVRSGAARTAGTPAWRLDRVRRRGARKR
ncbi:MAG: class I SAM-dependent methyltransferase [Alphaproteobacteria bacterium]